MIQPELEEMKLDIFHHLLSYVYGESVAEDILKANAKDIMNVVDRYSIVRA